MAEAKLARWWSERAVNEIVPPVMIRRPRKDLVKRKDGPSKVKSFKDYCTELLEESNVTGVPSITASKGWIRKFIKIIILCSGVVGFLMQTQQFLEIYWEYSTITSEEKLSHVRKPAITICDDNILSRQYYCENNPDKCRPITSCMPYCIDPKDTYRRELSFSGTFISEVFSSEMFHINVTKAAGFNIEKNILQCEWSSKVGETTVTTPCGNPEFVRGLNEVKLPAACYTLKSNDFVEELQGDSLLRMVVRWHLSDYIATDYRLDIGDLRRYWIHFHHPGHVSNPFAEGIQISQGKSYSARLTQVDTIRLPPPYSTKCFDYEEQWKKNNYKGALGREDCENTCEIELHFEKFGCVPREMDYPHDKHLCLDLISYDVDFKEKVLKCKKECREACTETKYYAEFQISSKMTPHQSFLKYGAFSAVVLDIFFDNQNSKTVVYRPRYESIELFSYVGGYLGVWLGWSLLAVFDFFEILFNVCLYPLYVRRNLKKKTRR